MESRDLPWVIAVHREAFRGYMNTRLGDRYLRHFFEYFIAEPAAIALVSEGADGRIGGYVVGAPLGYSRALDRRILLPALTGLLTSPGLLLDARVRSTAFGRLRGLLRRPPPAPPAPVLPAPCMSLVGIGVSEAVRSRGHGRALLQAFEPRARSLGAKSMRLSVYEENRKARDAYERAGWQPFEGPVLPGYAMYYSQVLR